MITALDPPVEMEVLAPSSPTSVPTEVDLTRERIHQLAEWMLEGAAKGYRQTKWTIMSHNSGEGYAFCALGMAILGMEGGSPERMRQQLSRLRGTSEWYSGFGIRTGLDPGRVWVQHPITGCINTLFETITLLNDKGEWTAQAIAAFLFSLEYDPERRAWEERP